MALSAAAAVWYPRRSKLGRNTSQKRRSNCFVPDNLGLLDATLNWIKT